MSTIRRELINATKSRAVALIDYSIHYNVHNNMNL
jgi:hypothetical protein